MDLQTRTPRCSEVTRTAGVRWCREPGLPSISLPHCSSLTDTLRNFSLSGGGLMAKRVNVNTDELVRLYVDEKLSLEKISELMGCNHTTVRHRLMLAGVPKRKAGRIRHGAARRDGRTREYQSYRDAKKRCTNSHRKGYADWGGRGIRFLFTSFEQFYAELGPCPPGLTLDRIDNDGHYQVGNVRWATRTEQSRNQRPRRPRSRLTYCKRGHEFTPENTGIAHRGRHRYCRRCARERQRRRMCNFN